MPRFYVPNIDYSEVKEVPLPESAVHHAMRVLRMREGDRAEVFDGKGTCATGKIHFSKDFASICVEEIHKSEPPKLKLSLVQALVSNEKMDWIVEKACELGVSEIYVFPAERSEVKLIGDKLEKRLQRWQKIILSACEQCKRDRLPELHWLSSLEKLEAPIHEQRGFVLMPQSVSTHKPSDGKCSSVMYVVGPEGGLSEKEISGLLAKGFEKKQLGNLVLRTETAGIVAATYFQTLLSWN